MLQCTAVTAVPYYEALLALATMEGGPEHPPEFLAPDEFLLCELGEHDDAVEHAAHVWAAQTVEDRDLWLFWAGTGAHRVHRLDALTWCGCAPPYSATWSRGPSPCARISTTIPARTRSP
ncbi:hypothetical protein SMICM17S_00934 [Streptomyces microflavus]